MALRIDGANRLASRSEVGGAPRSAGAGFALPAGQAPRPAASGHVRPAASLDALLMLQEVSPEGERRRRAVKRGRGLLDLLDELRLALLDGEVPAALSERLAALLGELREATGDRSLDEALDAVELRAAVEAAKIAGARDDKS